MLVVDQRADCSHLDLARPPARWVAVHIAVLAPGGKPVARWRLCSYCRGMRMLTDRDLRRVRHLFGAEQSRGAADVAVVNRWLDDGNGKW